MAMTKQNYKNDCIIFNRILEQAMDYNFIDMETVFGDSTHQKANANKNKNKNVKVEVVKKIYDDELLEEINKDRKNHNKRPFEDIEKTEIMFDEETGK